MSLVLAAPPKPQIRRALLDVSAPIAADASLEEKVGALLQALETADLVETLRKELLPDESGRVVAASALKAVLNFVGSLGSDSTLLRKMIAAFDALEQGNTVPLMEPVSIANAHRASRYVFAIRGSAASYMQCLMDAGTRKMPAAKLVARELAKVWRDGGQKSPATIIKWREDATAPVPDKEMAEVYTCALALARSEPDPVEAARAMMRTIAAN